MKNKLFVWEEVLTDYTDGIMFALAPDVKTARKLALKAAGDVHSVREELRAEPKVYTGEAGFAVWGGG